MKCPNCNAILREVLVKVHGATSKVKSYQCTKCDYFSFDAISSKEVIEELRQTPLQIEQKVIKLSGDRLGMYFSKDIVRSMDLKKGESVYVSMPDKNKLLLERKTKYKK